MDAPSIDPTTLVSAELAGSAGLGFVWGWLLVQLTVVARPSVQRWVVPLVATVALLGSVFVLLDVQALVTGAGAIGASALLHAALVARLQSRSLSDESYLFSGGGSR